MASGSSEILLTTLVLLSGNVFSIRNTNLKNFNLITTPNLKKIAFSLKKNNSGSPSGNGEVFCAKQSLR